MSLVLSVFKIIINTIRSVDNLIENHQEIINKICNILSISLKRYENVVTIEHYDPKKIKSGIIKFDKAMVYTDTSTIGGIDNISNGANWCVSNKLDKLIGLYRKLDMDASLNLEVGIYFVLLLIISLL